eukprot:m.462802 g.462802  ORF g.462802 m.462802 type:complete len:81 (-) comp22802_c0_seq1:800-1042(-)
MLGLTYIYWASSKDNLISSHQVAIAPSAGPTMPMSTGRGASSSTIASLRSGGTIQCSSGRIDDMSTTEVTPLDVPLRIAP